MYICMHVTSLSFVGVRAHLCVCVCVCVCVRARARASTISTPLNLQNSFHGK